MRSNRDIEKLIDASNQLALKFKHEFVGTEHVLYCMITNKEFKKILIEFGVQISELEAELRDYYKNQSRRLELTNKRNKKTATSQELEELEKIRPLAQGLVNRTTKEADYLEKNMTFEQKQLTPIVRSSFLG